MHLGTSFWRRWGRHGADWATLEGACPHGQPRGSGRDQPPGQKAIAESPLPPSPAARSAPRRPPARRACAGPPPLPPPPPGPPPRRDPRPHTPLQHRKGDGAAVEEDVVEALDVEAGTECALGFGTEREDAQLAGLVGERLAGP